MRDYGLLASIAAVLAVPALLVRPWPPQEPDWRLLDRVGGSLAVGLIVGRLAALAIDDPRSLTSVADLLVIRSGVDFWPGLTAGIAWLAWTEHRADRRPAALLGTVASAGLVGWAAYEAASQSALRRTAGCWPSCRCPTARRRPAARPLVAKSAPRWWSRTGGSRPDCRRHPGKWRPDCRGRRVRAPADLGRVHRRNRGPRGQDRSTRPPAATPPSRPLPAARAGTLFASSRQWLALAFAGGSTGIRPFCSCT